MAIPTMLRGSTKTSPPIVVVILRQQLVHLYVRDSYLSEAEGIRVDDSLLKEPLVYPYSLQIMLSSLAK
jgi:hypothetical protein